MLWHIVRIRITSLVPAKSAGLIKTIESVQRRFTASLPGCKHLTCTERLKLLHIDSLDKRRLKADLAFTYKIIFGLVNLNLSDFFHTEDKL